eukprot:scaffold23499_cov109-Cylindrotheca_fusiformis.AAC.10
MRIRGPGVSKVPVKLSCLPTWPQCAITMSQMFTVVALHQYVNYVVALATATLELRFFVYFVLRSSKTNLKSIELFSPDGKIIAVPRQTFYSFKRMGERNLKSIELFSPDEKIIPIPRTGHGF